MTRRAPCLVTALLSLLALVLAPVAPLSSASTAAQILAAPPVIGTPAPTSRSSLMFIENVGQFDKGARFQVQGGQGTTWLTQDGIWIAALEAPPHSTSNAAGALSQPPMVNSQQSVRRAVNLKLSFPGSNPHPRLEGFSPLSTQVSYLKGRDPSHWHADVPAWGGVRYVDLYPGIDLDLAGTGTELVPRLLVHSGGDLRQVRLRIEGSESIAIAADHLSLTTAVGMLSFPLLQVAGGNSVSSLQGATPARLNGEEIIAPFAELPATPQPERSSVRLAGSSLLAYSTLVATDENDCANWDCSIAVDTNGNVYLAGTTYATSFPTSVGVYQPLYGGGYADAFVAKLNPTGTALLFATYLGGSAEDSGISMKLGGDGSIYLAGKTQSEDFPVTPGAYQETCGIQPGDCTSANNLFMAKLDSSGSHLLYGTYYGAGTDRYCAFGYARPELAVDAANDVYMGCYVILGTSGMNFGGGALVKLHPAGQGSSDLVYGLALAGGVFGVTVDAAGNAWVTGAVAPDFQPTPDAYMPTCPAEETCIGSLIKLDLLGTTVYATLLPTAGFLARDAGGALYSVTNTSNPLLTTAGAYDTTFDPLGSLYALKFDPVANTLVYATYLAGNRLMGITVDNAGQLVVTGETNSCSFPVTPDAVQPVCGSDIQNNLPYYQQGDAFITQLNATGTALRYSSYVGSSSKDMGTTVTADAQGNVFLGGIANGGVTDSPDFPTTPGAYMESGYAPLVSWYFDAFVQKLNLGQTTVITPVEPDVASTMALPNDAGEITFPAGLVTDTTDFVYNQMEAPIESSGSFAYTGHSFTLVATDSGGNPVTSFATSYVMTLHYSDTDWEGAGISNESLINLYYWDTATNAWIGILPCSGCSLDTDNNVLTAVLNHLTEFALMATLSPLVNAVAASPAPVQIGAPVTASTNFLYAQAARTHTAVWDWGDGQTSSGTLTEGNGSGTVAGTHTYASAGVYTVKVTITDDKGFMGAAEFRYVVIYAPNGGFVTGGGWITSPPGAYPGNPTATGKADFNINPKYQKGDSTPKGKAAFNLQGTNLDFRSSALEWLVITGPKAQMKGTGIIKGSGSYSFMLTAIDGQVSGGGGVDKVRIKIWDTSSGAVVYDNQMGANDTADPTTVVAGGSVVIHKD